MLYKLSGRAGIYFDHSSNRLEWATGQHVTSPLDTSKRVDLAHVGKIIYVKDIGKI